MPARAAGRVEKLYPEIFRLPARSLFDLARREKMTLRDLYNITAAARGHWVICGTPKRIADTLEEWFLAGLADVRATSFVDSAAKTGLQTPAMIVVAKFDDGKKEERVTFGKNGTDVFASRPEDPGAAKIEAEKFDEAVKALDELSKPEAPAAPPAK